ncbi:MAG TPA: amino acid adenylation domain-containing protein, partial [Ktedonobacteraceae bacterium]|nr:amino acid adenylation domain-containing protein [Ktedonobacteraceae bacterium]
MSTHDARGSVEHLAKLSREQRAQIFQRLKEKQRGERIVDETIRLHDRNAQSFPLSFAQLRLWFLDQFEPNIAVYIIPQALRLSGPLIPEMLRQALGDMIERHETLRTTFIAIDGEPRQFIAKGRQAAIPLIDLQDVGEAVREAEVLRVADAEAHHLFDLAVGPLLRITLLRLGPEEHILLLTMHHIISDAWSGGIFMREFFICYEARLHGRSAQLPALPIQYIDFALWQHQRLQGTKLEEQLAYWKVKLADVPMLYLPTDHPRPAMQTFRGAAQSLLLSESLSSALHALSRQEGATLFMTLLAAFKVLLYRYNGQEDIVVGSLIANRNRAEIEGLIGFFVNTLVLRTDLSGSPTFRLLLRREREVCLEAYAQQDLPFEQLVDALQPERNLSYSPLFQVMFTLQNMPHLSSSSAGQSPLAIQYLDTGTATSKFDLSLFLSEGPHGLNIEAEYNTDLFAAETIQRMLTCFRNLLEGIAADPDREIATLPLLSEDERQQLLVEWNATRLDYPQHSCLQELIEEQVQRTPEAVALLFEEQQLTYGELNARATRLAHYLCYHYSIGPETLIGLALDRSPALLIGLLAILKAGAAYVPLDPDYPQQRLAFVLQQTQTPVLLTQAALLERLPEHPGATLCLDRDWLTIARDLPLVRTSRVVANNLAYTLYTSGSTGVPKGVQIAHQALVNFLCSMRNQLEVSGHDTLLAVTSISFDIAGLELWLPLMVGARLVLASREVSRDGEQLKQHLIEQAATVMQATPTTWRLLLEVGWYSSSEMRILCGGEALPTELAQTLSRPSALFWNMYGPTETTIWSALHRITTVEGNVSIGRPIGNTQIYLLNAQMEPVPMGAIGDLYIGGDGLSRGYFQRPEATAERFLPDPFGATPGERLYKTGDLARYRANGDLEFLGRNDHQVKIHGFRIELQEIEATLEQHPSVRESVVVARDDAGGESDSKRLIAYIVPQLQRQLGRGKPLLEIPINNATIVSSSAQLIGKEGPYEKDWQDEQVQQWQSVWDTTYSEDEADHDPAFDLSGWRSSYTHEPIPAEEMREWVDQTVER